MKKGNMLIKSQGIESSPMDEGYYPSLSIPGKAVDLSDKKIGTMVKIIISGKIKGMFSDKSGDRCEIEVHNAEYKNEE